MYRTLCHRNDEKCRVYCQLSNQLNWNISPKISVITLEEGSQTEPARSRWKSGKVPKQFQSWGRWCHRTAVSSRATWSPVTQHIPVNHVVHSMSRLLPGNCWRRLSYAIKKQLQACKMPPLGGILCISLILYCKRVPIMDHFLAWKQLVLDQWEWNTLPLNQCNRFGKLNPLLFSHWCRARQCSRLHFLA